MFPRLKYQCLHMNTYTHSQSSQVHNYLQRTQDCLCIWAFICSSNYTSPVSALKHSSSHDFDLDNPFWEQSSFHLVFQWNSILPSLQAPTPMSFVKFFLDTQPLNSLSRFSRRLYSYWHKKRPCYIAELSTYLSFSTASLGWRTKIVWYFPPPSHHSYNNAWKHGGSPKTVMEGLLYAIFRTF